MRLTDRSSSDFWVCHLGLIPYSDGIAIQETLRALRQAREIPDTLLLLEHPPTYTRGRRAGAEELPFPRSFYEAKGIELHETDRGGRVTYHAPGQLIGYPIMAVNDVVAHLRTIEQATVDALAEAGLQARARPEDGPDYTGVWVEQRKIASLGVHISRGVSTHGFAVNVENDLEPFSWVIACGLPDVTMTSIAAETNGDGERIGCFRKRIAHSFCQAHGRRQRLVSPQQLDIATKRPDRPAPSRAQLKSVSSSEKVPA